MNWLALFRIEEIHTFRFKWNRKWHWNGFHPRKLAGFASNHRRTISVPVHWTPKFFLLSHNAYQRPRICCAKREHKMSSRFIWLVVCWTVYGEWMMQRNTTCGNFQMDSATGVKVCVVDFRGKLVSVVVIIKWTFMTSWYDLKTTFRNRKYIKLNYHSVCSHRLQKFVMNNIESGRTFSASVFPSPVPSLRATSLRSRGLQSQKRPLRRRERFPFCLSLAWRTKFLSWFISLRVRVR